MQVDRLRAETEQLTAKHRDAQAQLTAVRCELQTAQAQLAEMHGLHDQLAKELAHKVEALASRESELLELRRQRAVAATSAQELEIRCDAVRTYHLV
jgi:chromosome segregation ATPase